jgi:hypothetical protein
MAVVAAMPSRLRIAISIDTASGQCASYAASASTPSAHSTISGAIGFSTLAISSRMLALSR